MTGRSPFRLALSATLAILFAGGLLPAQGRPALTARDYARWESLGFGATFSPRGEWFAYVVNRVNEENELRIRGGPRDTTLVAAYGSAPAFSVDGRWLAYTVGVSPAERDRLEREKKPVRTAVAVRDLVTGAVTTTAEISAFRFSADGRHVAMRRHPEEGKRTADLLVVDLARGSTLTLGSVSDWQWADRGALLAVAVEAGKGAGNAVQLFDATTGALKVLDSSPSLYRALAWRAKSDDLAVLRTKADSGFRDTTHVALAWSRVTATNPVRRELDPASAAGYPRELRVAEHRRPEWAKDGSIVFVGLRPRERAPARRDTAAAGTRAGGNGDGGATAQGARQRPDSARAAAEKPSDVQVWHAKDVRIMPMQKAQEQQDLQRTLLAAWHLGDGRVVQIGSDLQEQVRVLPGARYATETDRRAYEFGTMFGRPYQDVHVIDVRTGERRTALEKVRYFGGASATGRKLLWYDGRDWWTQDVASGARTNLTARLDVDFGNPDWDTPGDLVPPVGAAGWTVNDGAVLVHDAYDVWRLAPDGSGGRRLTDGAARKLVHRYARTGSDEDGIDLAKGVYLSLFGRRSKQSGYGRLTARGVEPLVLEDARVTRLVKADSATMYAFTRERFDDSPDWFVGGAALRDARQASATNPFQGQFAWGKSELVDFRSDGGRDLQAALYYPANYDPAKQYPMIVYTYELLSQNVHQYSAPTERGYYNHTVWTQNGYFVLEPDIVFRGREPGPSVLEAVVPAVRAIVQRGLVDSARVGHIGHSWGGYEAAYLPTRTHIFAASVSGAAITNFLSFAGAIHWTPGIAEFDHWETGQARMDVPPWEDLEAYLRSSPIAKVQDLRTPMLMMFGDADGTVDWHQGIEFYNFARRAGRKDFVLLVYPGEDHGLRKKQNQVDYHRRILQWFGHYLKGEPAPKWMTEGYPWLERKSVLDAAK